MIIAKTYYLVANLWRIVLNTKGSSKSLFSILQIQYEEKFFLRNELKNENKRNENFYS